MASLQTAELAQRYVRWLTRRSAWIMLAAFLVLQAALYLTVFHLPLRADFSHLLPEDAPSVVDLRRLEQRVSAQDTLLVIVEAPTPELRAAVAAELTAAIRALPPELVSGVSADDAETRAFLRAKRHLFVPLQDLEQARDALKERIDKAKASAVGIIDFDEEDSEAAAAAGKQKLDELRAKRRAAEARLDRSSHVSEDGRLQQLVVRTGFVKTDVARGKQLLAAVGQARDRALAVPGREGVKVGMAGGVAGQAAEHTALIRGMVKSSIVTALLVALVLALYFRSIRMLALLTVALVVGTVAAFGAAALTVGHLNAATAFLGAIIAGNGVNYGIFLVARFLEERRRQGRTPEQAMAEAIRTTLRPTLVASLGASIAYGALAATSFRGFADFAVIGAVGMALCWIASYTLLPAMILRFVPRLQVNTKSDGILGSWLARLLGFRHARVVCLVTGGLAVAAGVLAWRFVRNDPYEYDIKQLRSRGPEAQEFHRWAQTSDQAFGRGISGQTIIAADNLDQVPKIVDALKKIDEHAPADRRTIGTIRSYLDVVPPDQPAKIKVLNKIYQQLEEAGPDLEELPADERAEIEALRPPKEPTPFDIPQLPEEIQGRLREADGRVGYLVTVRPDDQLDEWDARDLARFAGAVRTVTLAGGETVTTSGAPIIFADIIAAIRSDAPFVVLLASALLVLMVLLVVGPNVRALAVLLATGTGSILLVAVCALAGLKVNFLDFIALPITLGLGIDYAINMAARHHDGDHTDPFDTLKTSGAAVFVCSLTTIIGYGSLLTSDNLAIRGFGSASLIGEVCCVTTALVLVPAVVSLGRRRRAESVDRVGLDAR
jgi:predicted RND superfamily exporter protein